MSSASLPPSARTWRDIPQEIAPRAMSREGRKRRVFSLGRTAVWSLLLAASLYGGYEIWHAWQEDPRKVRAAVKATPVKSVALRTDGVLDLSWVNQRLALAKGADLMELDLFTLRERLVNHPQVKNAVLQRRFPDTLSVVLEERTPVAHILVQFSDSKPLPYCISRDGVLFQGVNFSPELLATLPYIEGARLKKQGRGLAPVEGMDAVSDLIQAARINTPAFYRTWKVVSLSRFAADGNLVVRTSEIPEIIFGTRDDFTKQIAQLDYLLDELKVRGQQFPIRSINLSVGLSANGVQVPVAFAPLPPDAGLKAPLAPHRDTAHFPSAPKSRRSTSL